jgi:hypothetical protein
VRSTRGGPRPMAAWATARGAGPKIFLEDPGPQPTAEREAANPSLPSTAEPCPSRAERCRQAVERPSAFAPQSAAEPRPRSPASGQRRSGQRAAPQRPASSAPAGQPCSPQVPGSQPSPPRAPGDWVWARPRDSAAPTVRRAAQSIACRY